MAAGNCFAATDNTLLLLLTIASSVFRSKGTVMPNHVGEPPLTACSRQGHQSNTPLSQHTDSVIQSNKLQLSCVVKQTNCGHWLAQGTHL